MASWKLKHYFQEHPITVISSAPLEYIIQNREATRRIAKWAIELGAYHIQYKPPKYIICIAYIYLLFCIIHLIFCIIIISETWGLDQLSTVVLACMCLFQGKLRGFDDTHQPLTEKTRNICVITCI